MTLEEAKRLLAAFEGKKDNSNDGAIMAKLRTQIAAMEEDERKAKLEKKAEFDKWEVAENERRKEHNLPPVTPEEKKAFMKECQMAEAEAIEKAQGQELRAATERGRIAKQNQTFPTMPKGPQKYNTNKVIHVSPVSIIGSSTSILGR